MNIQGYEIKIGRPKAYSGTMSALGIMSHINSMQFDAKNAAGVVQYGNDPFSTAGIQNPLMGGKMADEIFKV